MKASHLMGIVAAMVSTAPTFHGERRMPNWPPPPFETGTAYADGGPAPSKRRKQGERSAKSKARKAERQRRKAGRK